MYTQLPTYYNNKTSQTLITKLHPDYSYATSMGSLLQYVPL